MCMYNISTVLQQVWFVWCSFKPVLLFSNYYNICNNKWYSIHLYTDVYVHCTSRAIYIFCFLGMFFCIWKLKKKLYIPLCELFSIYRFIIYYTQTVHRKIIHSCEKKVFFLLLKAKRSLSFSINFWLSFSRS